MMAESRPGTTPEMKWQCPHCSWLGKTEDMLEAPSPFDKTDTLIGCPQCKMVCEFINLCDECDKEATCGLPHPDGYKRLCYDHYKAYK